MELALYGPDGYYASPRTAPGRATTTRPRRRTRRSARCLAVQVRQLWELMGSPPQFHVVEVGAGGCQLAQSFV